VRSPSDVNSKCERAHTFVGVKLHLWGCKLLLKKPEPLKSRFHLFSFEWLLVQISVCVDTKLEKKKTNYYFCAFVAEQVKRSVQLLSHFFVPIGDASNNLTQTDFGLQQNV
jgi:hypothetical protein